MSIEETQAVIEAFEQAVRLAPDSGEAWAALSEHAQNAGEYDKSLAAGEKAVALEPQNSVAWLRYGIALYRKDRDDDAFNALQTALKISPNLVNAWTNLAMIYQARGQYAESEMILRMVLDMKGQAIQGEGSRIIAEEEYGDAHWNLSVIELSLGKYRQGFARYRARFKRLQDVSRLRVPQPLWQGEDLAGKTILVTTEQGHGDLLMMARFLPLLKAKGGRVLFAVPPLHIPLFDGWAGADQILLPSQIKNMTFDYHASIFDLPYALGTTLETLPRDVPYLPCLPPDERTTLPDEGRLKVGVIWAGHANHEQDTRRSTRRNIPLETIDRLFTNPMPSPGLQFFSLTHNLRAGESERLSRLPVVDLAPRIKTFADTSRFLNQMDLVITCDTATAHIAGGMGKSTWTLLPFSPDWRWLTSRTETPWYPTMRIFRQNLPGEWNDVIDVVARALAQFVESASLKTARV